MKLAILGIGCALLVAAPAQAYIDPGTGSLILQGLLAAIAGALLTLRLYWSRVKAFVSGKRVAAEVVETDSPKIDHPSGQ